MNIKSAPWMVLAASFTVLVAGQTDAVAQEIDVGLQLNRVIVRLPVSQLNNVRNLREISAAQSEFSSVAEDINAVCARPLKNLPLTAVEVDKEGLAELVRKGYSVVSDTIDKPMLSDSVPVIGAPETWSLGVPSRMITLTLAGPRSSWQDRSWPSFGTGGEDADLTSQAGSDDTEDTSCDPGKH